MFFLSSGKIRSYNVEKRESFQPMYFHGCLLPKMRDLWDWEKWLTYLRQVLGCWVRGTSGKEVSMVKGSLNQGSSEKCRIHKISIIVTWSSGLLCCFLLCKPGSQEEVPLSIPRITVRTEVECILRLSDPHPKYSQPEFPKSGLFFGLETLECT